MRNAWDGSRSLIAGCALLVAAVAVAVYLNTLGSGFVYDDKIQIVLNPWVTSVRYLTEIFSSHSFGFSEKKFEAISYRPMVFVVYMIEHALFGLKPWGWHLVNVIMHAANSVMVFFLVSAFLSSSDKNKGEACSDIAGCMPPVVAGVIFAVHPVNTEAVAWVGCIPELFYTILTLGAFYLFILSLDSTPDCGRPVTGCFLIRASSVLLFFMAALTKETAVLMPILFFIYDRLRGEKERLLSIEIFRRYIPYLFATFIYMAIRFYVLGGRVAPAEKLHPFLTWPEFVLNSLVLLARDLRMMLLPIGGYPLQLLDPVYSIAEPKALIAVIALIAIPVVMVVMRKRLSPLLILSLFCMVLPLLPTLYAPAISRTPYADRYMYLPSVGYVLILALVAKRGYAWGSARGGRVALWWVVAVFVLIASVFAAWSARKALFWKDDLTLWRSVLQGSPENYIAVHSIGGIYFSEGWTDDAIKTLELALRLNEESAHPDPTMLLATHKVLATAYGEKGLVDKAVNEYNIILNAEPDHVVANYNLALLYKQKGRYSEAIELYTRALVFANKPWQFKDIYFSLAESYSGLGLWDEAVRNYEYALKYAPGDTEIIERISEARKIGR